MANVTVDSNEINKPRFKILGRLIGSNRFDAMARMIAIWGYCTEQNTYYLTPEIIDEITEYSGFCSKMCSKEVHLGERKHGKILIVGTRGRIEWYKKLKENAKKGGEANRANWLAKRLANTEPTGYPVGNPAANAFDSLPIPIPTPTPKEKGEAKKTEKERTAPDLASQLSKTETERSHQAQVSGVPTPVQAERAGAGLSLVGSKNILEPKPGATPPIVGRFFDLWQMKSGGMGKAVGLSQGRIESILKRLAEVPDIGYWEKVIQRMEKNPFFRGENERRWKGNIDFLIADGNHLRVMEGQYEKRTEEEYRAEFDRFLRAEKEAAK